jgi:hypothetical protein
MSEVPSVESLYDENLTQWLQLSGEYIARVRPPEERVPWVLFLLQEVRPFVPPEEYSAFLRQLQQEIGERAAAG